jgi:hypothetical protein
MKNSEKFKWTEEKTAFLLEKWPTYDSLKVLAAALDTYPSVLVDKANKLSLGPRPKLVDPNKPLSRWALDKLHDPERRRRELAALMGSDVPVPVFKHEALSCCAWIVSEGKPTVYCDVPTERGKSYCPDHCAVVFRQPSAWEEKLLTGV